METLEIYVHNIKCAGCMNTIKKAVKSVDHVEAVEIDLETEKVTVQGDDVDLEKVVATLAHHGYPEKGHNTLLNQAKSYVSCAIGRMSSDQD